MTYFERALVAVVVIGAVSGLVGSVVVLRRRVFFAQALTHGTFPGAVAAAALGVAVPIGAAVASVALVGVMLLVSRMRSQGAQVAAGIVLTGGFALGAILQALLPDLPIRAESFLIGSILTVTEGDVALSATVLVLAAAVFVAFGKELVFSTFDPVGYRAAGYRGWPMELLVLALVAAAVVSSLPAVGAILAIALIAAPAAAARLLMPTVGRIVLAAPLIGAASGVIGLLVSREWGVAAGPAIALAACGFFLLALAAHGARRLHPGSMHLPVETAEEAVAP